MLTRILIRECYFNKNYLWNSQKISRDFKELQEHKLVYERENKSINVLIFEQLFCYFNISHRTRCVVCFVRNVYERLFSRFKLKRVNKKENNDALLTLLNFVYCWSDEVCICFNKLITNVFRSVRYL